MSCNFAASVNKICLVKSNLSNEGRGSCKVEGGGGLVCTKVCWVGRLMCVSSPGMEGSDR